MHRCPRGDTNIKSCVGRPTTPVIIPNRYSQGEIQLSEQREANIEPVTWRQTWRQRKGHIFENGEYQIPISKRRCTVGAWPLDGRPPHSPPASHRQLPGTVGPTHEDDVTPSLFPICTLADIELSLSFNPSKKKTIMLLFKEKPKRLESNILGKNCKFCKNHIIIFYFLQEFNEWMT